MTSSTRDFDFAAQAHLHFRNLVVPSPEERARHARELRLVYARVDPDGYDARRLPACVREALRR